MTKTIIKVVSLLLGTLFLSGGVLLSVAAPSHAPMQVDQAFIFTPSVNDSKTILLHWQMAPGYYLYRDKISIETTPSSPLTYTLPQGELKYGANNKRHEVYFGTLSLPVRVNTLANADTGAMRLSVQYQGCAADGFCYPPILKTYHLDFSTQTLVPDETSTFDMGTLLTSHQGVQALFHTEQWGVMLLLFVGLGLLLSFTPCVLPMVPILTSIILGQAKRNTSKAFLLSLTYVLGMSVTYAAAGVMAALLGSSLHVWLQTPWMIAGVSLIFVLLGFSLLGAFDLNLPRYFQQGVSAFSSRLAGGHYVGVGLMGVLSTLIVSPCVTAPLVGVLMYIGESGSVFLGGTALFALGIGMGIPLLLIGTSAGKWVPKSGPWMVGIKYLLGLLMLAMAIWLASRILGTAFIVMLWGCFLVVCAWLLRRVLPRMISALSYGVGMAGVLLMVGGAVQPDRVNEWVRLVVGERATTPFTVVKDIASVNQALLLAERTRQPVILDFYADWCESCVVMDKEIFNPALVKEQLRGYVLLRADLSQNNAADAALLQYFKVIAPPTILFFNAKGQENISQRIVGQVNTEQFLERLHEDNHGF